MADDAEADVAVEAVVVEEHLRGVHQRNGVHGCRVAVAAVRRKVGGVAHKQNFGRLVRLGLALCAGRPPLPRLAGRLRLAHLPANGRARAALHAAHGTFLGSPCRRGRDSGGRRRRRLGLEHEHVGILRRGLDRRRAAVGEVQKAADAPAADGQRSSPLNAVGHALAFGSVTGAVVGFPAARACVSACTCAAATAAIVAAIFAAAAAAVGHGRQEPGDAVVHHHSAAVEDAALARRLDALRCSLEHALRSPADAARARLSGGSAGRGRQGALRSRSRSPAPLRAPSIVVACAVHGVVFAAGVAHARQQQPRNAAQWPSGGGGGGRRGGGGGGGGGG